MHAVRWLGEVLCSGSQDRSIRLWSLDTFHATKVITGHAGEVRRSGEAALAPSAFKYSSSGSGALRRFQS